MKTILLGVSLCCLIPPFTGVGIAGLLGWVLITALFRVADEGAKQMSAEIADGNTGAGTAWLVAVLVVVALGGLTIMAVAAAVAGEMRGQF